MPSGPAADYACIKNTARYNAMALTCERAPKATDRQVQRLVRQRIAALPTLSFPGTSEAPACAKSDGLLQEGKTLVSLHLEDQKEDIVVICGALAYSLQVVRVD